jgi:hypothetical protein
MSCFALRGGIWVARIKVSLAIALFFLAQHAPIPVAAAPQRNSELAGVAAGVDELNAHFVYDAFRVRELLRQQGPAERAFADSFWTSVAIFANIVSDADGSEKDLFAPLLTSMRATLNERVLNGGTVDMATLSEIQASLQEQIQVNQALGSAPGARRGADFNVLAWSANRLVAGLTVWVDLACCVRNAISALPLQRLTNHAAGRARPGTYVVRLLRAGQLVACKRIRIGSAADRPQVIDISVADHDCRVG